MKGKLILYMWATRDELEDKNKLKIKWKYLLININKTTCEHREGMNLCYSSSSQKLRNHP